MFGMVRGTDNGQNGRKKWKKFCKFLAQCRYAYLHLWVQKSHQNPSADPNPNFDLFLTCFCFGNYLKSRWSFYVLHLRAVLCRRTRNGRLFRQVRVFAAPVYEAMAQYGGCSEWKFSERSNFLTPPGEVFIVVTTPLKNIATQLRNISR